MSSRFSILRNARSRRLRFERLEDRSLLALVADILDVTPDPRTTAVQNVQIDFSNTETNTADPANGLDVSDFLLTRDGETVTLLPSMLSPTDQDFHAQYALNLSTVTTIPATYQLTLFAAGSLIKDSDGNLLSADASDTWVITDAAAPTATIANVTPNPRSSAVGSVAITFNESVSGVDRDDFLLTRDGTEVSLSDASLSGSGTNYTLNLANVTAIAGTYVLTLVAAESDITDNAGNPLASNASTTWVTETTAPTATIATIFPNPRTTPVGNVAINFSETVTGVDISDFALTRNGLAVSTSGLTVSGSGANYTLNLSTVTSTAGNYVLTLHASGSGISDTAGNVLVENASVTWINDLTGPTVDIVDVTPDPRSTPVGDVKINFNEDVVGVDIRDFTLARNGTMVSLDGLVVSGSGANYTLNLSTVTTVFGSYTLTLVASGSGITDQAGNALVTNPNVFDSFTIDDEVEDNDRLAKATELGRLTQPVTVAVPLGLVDFNDWFRFTTSVKGTATDNVKITFSNAQGNLDLELYNVSGQRLGASTGSGNSETISLNGRAAGTYYVRVFGKAGAINPEYSLTINAPRVPVDDIFENNDTRATANNLGAFVAAATISNLALLDSHDWYRFSTTSTGTSANSVSINFVNSAGNLDLELYNASGIRLASAVGSTNIEKISLAGRAAGTYYVHVLGKYAAKNVNYSLSIAPPSSAAFNIQFNFDGLTASQISTVEQAADKWQKIIVADIPSSSYVPSGSSTAVSVDDVLIDVFSFPIDGVGEIAAGSAPDVLRAGSFLPVHGDIVFDSADLAQLQAEGLLYSTALHEMAHVLGFGSIWEPKGLLIGAGTADPQFTGAQAVAAYNMVFGTNATGVPVEDTGGAGTADSHWRETVLGTELMTGFLDLGDNPLSKITIAALADLGYTVNLALADPYTKPSSILAPNSLVGSNSKPSLHISSPATLDALLANWRSMKHEVRQWIGKA